MLKIGDRLKCFKSVWSGGRDNSGIIIFKSGHCYDIVAINKHDHSVFIYDESETKRPISTNFTSANSICVYWKKNFTCREYSLSTLLDN